MRVPLSWLRDFTPVDIDVNALADTFNSLGLIVEGIERVGEGLDGVVVARVLDVRPHPDADRVRLADVDLGDGEALQIACGAANLATGQLVPVATIGTVLPGDFKIERRKLRGEWSNGMICSSDELGLAGERAGGILVLPDNLTVGASFTEAMGMVPDVVFDLEIETNRPDAMCVAGIARDIAGKLKLPFAIPTPVVREGGEPTHDIAFADVRDQVLCPRFSARAITNVTVGPSPELIARRLTLAGMRPINNIVDASNYVMLELGQPSHPFDLDKLPGRGLIVRRANEGETLETLDGTVRKLTGRDGVVCDGEDHIVAIAGIMGGASSEISDTTTTVFCEAAVWDPYSLNYTSRRLALRTDASARFERRVDYQAVGLAQLRFCEIVQQSSPAAIVAPELLDIEAAKPSARPIAVRTARVNAVLGTSLTDEQIRNYLAPIGFETVANDDGVNDVVIPSFRPDSEREIDIIEEIARMHGYANIERRVPTATFVGALTPHQKTRRWLGNLLLGLGFTEAWTAPLLAPGDMAKAGLSEDAVELVNPILKEESKLRTSFLPGFLRSVSLNLSRRNAGVRLFEIGHVFGTPLEGNLLPNERERVALVLSADNDDARSAAATWAAICDGMRVRDVEIVAATVAGLHPTRAAEIRAAGTVIGWLGEVDPHVLRENNIDRRVGWIEVDTELLFAQIEQVPQSAPISKFPAAEFDLAFIVPDDVPASNVEATIREAVGPLLESIGLFDVFRGAQVDESKRSLAYRLRIAALDHTLSESEVADTRRAAITAVEQQHSAGLRS